MNMEPNCKNKECVFSTEEIIRFEEDGYILCRQVFSCDTAKSCRLYLEKVLEKDDIFVGNKDSWVQRKGLSVIYNASDGLPWEDVFTQRLHQAVDELCGKNSWLPFGCGWWVVTFPGICSPPWKVDGNWHVDGSWHTHFPFSKEVGLVPVMLFSDILPEGGGTAVSVGSHKLVTDILLESGFRGVRGPDIAGIALARGFNDYKVVELTGRAGDVIFLHPHLLHARSTNLGQHGPASIRYMCHPSVVLKHHMDYSVNLADMTPVARAVVHIGSDQDGGNLNLLRAITPEAVEAFSSKKKNKRRRRGDDVEAHSVCKAQRDNSRYNLSHKDCLRGKVNNGAEGNKDRLLDPSSEIANLMGFSDFAPSKY